MMMVDKRPLVILLNTYLLIFIYIFRDSKMFMFVAPSTAEGAQRLIEMANGMVSFFLFNNI